MKYWLFQLVQTKTRGTWLGSRMSDLIIALCLLELQHISAVSEVGIMTLPACKGEQRHRRLKEMYRSGKKKMI